MDFLRQTLDNSLTNGQRFLLPEGSIAHISAPGVIEFTPALLSEQASWLLLSAGVHGNETAPIELLNRIVADLFSGRLPLRSKLMVQLANVGAMRIAKRYVDDDMNQLFQRAHRQGTREGRRAAELEGLTRAFFATASRGAPRYHYDLHTTIRASAFEQFAICPFLHERPTPVDSLTWLTSANIAAVLLHRAPSHTYSYFTSRQLGVNAFTLELGKVHPFECNDLAQFTGIDQALRELIAAVPLRVPLVTPQPMNVFRAKYDLLKKTRAFVLHLENDLENFSPLPAGFVIADDIGCRYVTDTDQQRIVFPNPNVPPGRRAGIIVEPITLTANALLTPSPLNTVGEFKLNND